MPKNTPAPIAPVVPSLPVEEVVYLPEHSDIYQRVGRFWANNGHPTEFWINTTKYMALEVDGVVKFLITRTSGGMDSQYGSN